MAQYKMTALLAALFFLLYFPLSSNAFAVELSSFSACVQKSLNGLGFEAGPVDGKLGVNSKLAAANFLVGNAARIELPPLSNKTADKWCIELITKYANELPMIVVVVSLNYTNPSEIRQILSKTDKKILIDEFLKISRRQVRIRRAATHTFITIIGGDDSRAQNFEIHQSVKARGKKPILTKTRYQIPSYARRNPLIFVDGTMLTGRGQIEQKVIFDDEIFAIKRIVR